MSFRSQWSAENDQVLGNRGMQDNHRAHRSTGIVEHPLVGLKSIDVLRAVLLLQRVDKVIYDDGGISGADFDGDSRELLEFDGVEDVAAGKLGIEKVQYRQEQGDEEKNGPHVCNDGTADSGGDFEKRPVKNLQDIKKKGPTFLHCLGDPYDGTMPRNSV